MALTELYPSCGGTREGKLSGPKNSRIKNKVLPSRGERETERGALKKNLA